MTGPADHAPLPPNDDAKRRRQPSHAEILNQLERILSNAEFTSSIRLQKLLRFIVSETLAGRSDQLKEYPIALDVFDRDESFDPQTSSIVRVEASRLRGKLEKYNAINGHDDAVKITLPTGSYVPCFSLVNTREKANEQGNISSSLQSLPLRASARSIAIAIPAIIAVAVIVFYATGQSIPWSHAERKADASHINSIAVLPLRNFSGDPAEDYFSEGMTDALISGLAQKRVAHVTSMTSALAYKDSNRPIADIANELGVSHLVEGSVMRVGTRVRISVQLIEAKSDRHLWAESYERGMSDVLRLQDDVVMRIVSSIVEQITPTSTQNSTRVFDVDPVAYEAHLKGRFFLNSITEDGFKKAIKYFQQSIELEPKYAPSYSGMAACYCLLGGHGFELVKPSEGMPAAKKAVMESLRLDSQRAEPHAFLGIIQLKYDWDWRSAEESFERAIEINPSYSRAHIFYSFYLEAMGRQDEAIKEAKAARRLDPLSRAAGVNLGWQYLQADNLIDAKKTFEQTAEVYPNHWGVLWGVGQYHLHLREFNEALSYFSKSIAAGGGHALPISALGYTYAISDHPDQAREALRKLEALRKEDYVSPYHLATIHAGLGENDKAFALLEEAYDLRSRSMAWLNVAPEMDGLRSDPRFEELLLRIGLVK